jgi:hypothetical protein
MDFTFGVCATSSSKNYHKNLIESIENLNIPNYEILFIGDQGCQDDRVRLIEFDDSVRPGWITKKKNILTQEAQYDNIVYLHDYISFHPYWYEGFLKLNKNFDLCMNVILNSDGSRFRDWCLNPYSVSPPYGPITNREFFLPYEESGLSKKMYFSGSYWVGKKQFMLENPLDENLLWGHGEDIKWSEEVREKTDFVMNPLSIVYCQKYKHCDFELITQFNLDLLKQGLNSSFW